MAKHAFDFGHERVACSTCGADCLDGARTCGVCGELMNYPNLTFIAVVPPLPDTPEPEGRFRRAFARIARRSA